MKDPEAGRKIAMQDNISFYTRDWERRILEALYGEYRTTLAARKIQLRPAILTITDSESFWGRWHRETRTIEISRRLLLNHPWFHVVGILKHEMAHQLVDEVTRERETAHGEGFQRACRRLGVPEVFTGASVNLADHPLDWREGKTDEASEKMLEKVRKLLALATSANEHEAALAMNRVREIYSKYNLEDRPKSRFVHALISTGSKRMEIHEKKVAGILMGHFFVQVVLGQSYDTRRGEWLKHLEIIGTRENVLMAEYVYHFLVGQTEILVDQAARELGRKMDRVERKSYRLGILEGFSEKLSDAERPANTPTVIGQALIAFKKDRELDGYIAGVYPNLRTSRSSTNNFDSGSYFAGMEAGSKITLNKPVASRAGNLGKLLG